MRNRLLFLLLAPNLFSQNIITQNFDNVTTLTNWTFINSSNPLGSTLWYQGDITFFNAQEGNSNAYIACDFNSTGQTGNISNWLITPSIQLENGDVLKFWTRKSTTINSNTGEVFPDRLQVRLNKTNGANPNSNSEDVGGFTELLLDVNPTLNSTDYPLDWTQYSIQISGLAGSTNCKIGFRYHVNNGGAAAENSEYIGLDTFSIDRTLSTTSIVAAKFKVYPNPSEDILYIDRLENSDVQKVLIVDMTGKIVKETSSFTNSITISELKTGIYILNIQTNEGIAKKRIIKK